MNEIDLPLPPPDESPMTAEEILRHLREPFMSVGVDEHQATMAAGRSFMALLLSGWLSEWGFNLAGEPLYVPNTPPKSVEVIVAIEREK